MSATWPDIRVLAEPFLERPYAEHECWRLVHELMQAGGFVEVQADPLEAVKAVTEIWWQDDPRDPMTLVQPWDWYLMRRPKSGPAVQHIGVVLDSRDFIHVHLKAGVTIEPMRRWQHRLLQIARLRVFL